MIKLPELKNENELFIFLLHTIHGRFKDNAILKGGMVLRLLGSKRRTIDLDYIFIPFNSKKEIIGEVKALFSEIEGLTYNISVNSKEIKVNIEFNQLRSQVEINVAKSLRTEVISTSSLKDANSIVAPRIIKIMAPDIALAHKMAAWNERRLLRDIYDIYYFLEIQNISPDMGTLIARLNHVQSRIPALRKIKKMSFGKFLSSLKNVVDSLTQDDIEKELYGLFEQVELSGLSFKIKDTIGRFIAIQK